ncbi:MAG TPA: ATP-binding protein, partial [Polyangiaceae bacterium]
MVAGHGSAGVGESPRVPVLLVDDNPGNLLALEAVLDAPGYELVTAPSGEAANREVERRDFAAVLLDVQMPLMDGLDTAQRMRQVLGGERPVPIIFVTGIDAAPDRVRRAYAEGAVDFIQKPFDPATMRAKVAALADLYRARQRALLEQQRAEVALQALTDLAVRLSQTRTTEEVAAAIVEHGSRAAHADTTALYVLDDAENTLELIGHRGIAPELVERSRHLTETSSPAIFASLRSGTPTWVESAAEYRRAHPEMSRTEGSRVRAYWTVPLLVEGRTVGMLAMGFYREREFSARERSMVDTMARQCSQALGRAMRLSREDRARAWLMTTLRSIGDAVIATDASSRITFMNRVAEQLTGWTEPEATGRPLEEVFRIFSEETREASENPVAHALRDGTVVGLANHTVLRARSGSEVPIDDSAAPIRDPEGNLFGVVLVFRDVSVEKRDQIRRDFLVRAGAALASSLDYRATLATVAQCAVPHLADWCAVELVEPGTSRTTQVAVAHVDPAKVSWARELGERYPPDPNATTGVPQVIRTGTPQLYEEIPAAMIEAGARDEEHLRLIRELKLESAVVVPLRSRVTTLGAMTFIFADSGRRYGASDLAFAEEFASRAALAIENALAFKLAEESRVEELRMRRAADLANRVKDEFLATVSHELRTPLNAILGWTRILRTRDPSAETDRALSIIERNARQQGRLIDDVLDLSRLVSGAMRMEMQPTALLPLVASVVESLAPTADAKRITVRVDVPPALTGRVDAERFQQIVWNLLANAVKFTQADGHVWIEGVGDADAVRLSFRDDGEGIEPAVLPHVFDPFRQADNSRTRKHGGLGLGLAIATRIAGAHGGTITVESEGLGRGATFVLKLPFAATSAQPDARAVPASEPRPSAGPSLAGITVLVG